MNFTRLGQGSLTKIGEAVCCPELQLWVYGTAFPSTCYWVHVSLSPRTKKSLLHFWLASCLISFLKLDYFYKDVFFLPVTFPLLQCPLYFLTVLERKECSVKRQTPGIFWLRLSLCFPVYCFLITVPQFPHLQSGSHNVAYLRIVVRNYSDR